MVAPLIALYLSTTSQSICSFSGVHSTWTSVCDQCAYRRERAATHPRGVGWRVFGTVVWEAYYYAHGRVGSHEDEGVFCAREASA